MSPIPKTNPDKIPSPVQDSVPVVKPAPPIMDSKSTKMISFTPDHLFLVQEIERITGDTWSRGHFVNLVRQVDEQTIYAALSVTREKRSLESGVNGGAYFSATVRGMTGLGNLKAKPKRLAIPQQPQPDYPTPEPVSRSKPHIVHSDEPATFDPQSMKKGWLLSYKSGGVISLLSWIERGVSCVDVRNLWVQVKEMLPGYKEPDLVDKFIDVIAVRMKYHQALGTTACPTTLTTK